MRNGYMSAAASTVLLLMAAGTISWLSIKVYKMYIYIMDRLDKPKYTKSSTWMKSPGTKHWR